jgi:hypothetical protein
VRRIPAETKAHPGSHGKISTWSTPIDRKFSTGIAAGLDANAAHSADVLLFASRPFPPRIEDLLRAKAREDLLGANLNVLVGPWERQHERCVGRLGDAESAAKRHQWPGLFVNDRRCAQAASEASLEATPLALRLGATADHPPPPLTYDYGADYSQKEELGLLCQRLFVLPGGPSAGTGN